MRNSVQQRTFRVYNQVGRHRTLLIRLALVALFFVSLVFAIVTGKMQCPNPFATMHLLAHS